MKYYLFILVAVFLIPTPIHAIEFENRLPESVWEVENAFEAYTSL